MKTLIIAAALALSTSAALADQTVVNTGSTDVKVMYRAPGVNYVSNDAVYGFSCDELYVAPGKTVTVKGDVLAAFQTKAGPNIKAWFDSLGHEGG